MVKRSRIIRDYQDSGALNSLIGVHAAISDRAFLTKGGDVFSVLRIKGIDFEGREVSDLDHCCRRFEAALRTLGEACRVQQYLIKRSGADIPFEPHRKNPVLAKAIARRMEFLAGKALYNSDVYFVVTQEGGPADKVRNWMTNPLAALRQHLSIRSASHALDARLRRAEERLQEKVTGFVAQMQDSIQPALLDKQEAFQFLRRLLNFSAHQCDGIRLQWNQFVDYQACGSMIEGYRDHLRVGGAYVRVLTLKEPPARTFANMLRHLHEIDSDCIITHEWKPVPNDRVRSIIQSKRRHFHNSKASFLNYLSSQTAPQDVLIDDSASALVNELGTCLEELEVRHHHFGQFSMTVVLSDTDAERLNRSVAEAVKLFAAQDAQLIEERYNLLNAYLAAIPGNTMYNVRRMWFLSPNYADLSFLFAVHTGEPVNDHLNSEYLAVLETDHGTPYFFNLHCQDVGHTLVLGATGSGKSFFLNFIVTNMQKYSPRMFVFDLGRGYADIATLFGGSVLTMSVEKPAFTINPFVLPPTPANVQFLYSFVRVLIESNGYSMTTPDEKDLFEQISNLYAVDRSQRRLCTLANVLGRNLRPQLGKWIEGGPYARLFDNADDTLTLSPFQVFDFEGMDKNPAMLEPLLFYILHRANAAILDEPTTFKAFVMDEAWRFFRHPTIKSYITEALKTWRKKNAAMILATQSTDDLLQSGMLDVVIESCPTKIFLANPGMNREAYQRVFRLTETETALIAGLTPKEQLLLKRPDRTKVLSLHVDPVGYWLYTSDPFDSEKKRQAFERHGFELGLDFLARSTS